MIITCPKCKTQYKIDDNLLPKEGKQVHCTNCGNLWVAYPESEQEPEVKEAPKPENAQAESPKKGPFERDVYHEETPREVFANGKDRLEPETTSLSSAKAELSSKEAQPQPQPEPEEENVGDIFARLNSRKEDIEKDYENMSGFKKAVIKAKRVMGLGSRKNRILLYFILLSVSLISLFYFRYEITKKYPFTAPVYKALGIDSVVIGQGMHFDNVVKTEYFDEENDPKISVKGFVHNVSGKGRRIPVVWVKFMDKDGKIIDQAKKDLNSRIEDEEKIPFNIIIDKPRVFVKYIMVTFTADE